ncbi:divalent metal cation transporter [Allomuricauda sp. d1]|uniref:NRAMP family divalent metal transporter n=1 Tax=Allomuricauda sp. d1 TaxID=3136725 RepID=UPI0031D41E62
MKILLKNLGPGLLFASMAIGTSHLVLSTKAGAQYGWVMVIPIVLANVLKYPFFEFGVRYTHVTQKSLIQGYLNLGKGYLWTYAVVTLVSTFTILAALYVVTAGLLINLFQISGIGVGIVSLGLFVFISALLIIGRYKFLEDSLKVVISILFLALLITTVLVLYKGSAEPVKNFQRPEIFNEIGILFLISLVGWMPTAVEASGWVSMWSIEKLKASKQKPTLKEALGEFNLGYFLTALLAIFFMIIGCMTLYGTGTELSGNAVTFADQVVNLFTAHIGNWAYLIIAIGAFATMFSTCMTAHDAVSRVSLDVLGKLLPKSKAFSKKSSFAITVLVLAFINWIVISAFSANMGNLVALATFVSFVMAPIIGWMNLKTVMGHDIAKNFRPSKGLRVLTYLGILFLSAFALYYCWLIW